MNSVKEEKRKEKKRGFHLYGLGAAERASFEDCFNYSLHWERASDLWWSCG
jgi:hypothetical protein